MDRGKQERSTKERINPIQIEQFDFVEGKWQAEKGMTLANGADRVQKWKDAAHTWLHQQRQGTEFSADDLVKAVGLPDEGLNKNNVVGAWINAQNRQRKIRFDGHYRKSARVGRHTGLQRVWTVL